MEKIKESDIKNAELALVVTLRDAINTKHNGRLKGLLDKLSMAAKKEVNKLPRPTKDGLKQIGKALDKFEELSGWGKADKHLLTYVNSILVIIEPRDYQNINKILMDIVDYKERHKSVNMGSFWTAPEVAKKWRKSFYVDYGYKEIDNRMKYREEKKEILKKYNKVNGFKFKYVAECMKWLYETMGFSSRQIAKIFEYKADQVQKILNRLKTKMRPKGGVRFSLWLPEGAIEDIRSNNETQKVMAEKYNTSQTTISHIRRRVGKYAEI